MVRIIGEEYKLKYKIYKQKYGNEYDDEALEIIRKLTMNTIFPCFNLVFAYIHS